MQIGTEDGKFLRKMNLKWFVLVCAWLASSASGKSIQRLTMQRIIAEWMDIDAAGLGMNVPFNNSVQEVNF